MAMVGLYGLISYTVSRRTSEIGVRMALGADRVKVLSLVIRQGLILAGIGIAVGGVLATMTVPVVAAALVGLGASNAQRLSIVPILLLAVCAEARVTFPRAVQPGLIR